MLLDFKIEYAHPKKIYEFSRECFTETSTEIVNEVFSSDTPVSVVIKRHDVEYVEDTITPVAVIPQLVLVPSYQPLPLLVRVLYKKIENYIQFLDDREDIIPVDDLNREHTKILYNQEFWKKEHDVIKEITTDVRLMKMLNYQNLTELEIDGFAYEDVPAIDITSLGFEREIKFVIAQREFTYLDEIDVGLFETHLSSLVPATGVPLLSDRRSAAAASSLDYVLSGDYVMGSIIRHIEGNDRYYFTTVPSPSLDRFDTLILARMPDYGVPYAPTE